MALTPLSPELPTPPPHFLKVASALEKWTKTSPPPTILLNIHDELLLECPANSEDVTRLKNLLFTCCGVECTRDLGLKVELELHYSVGKSWGKAMRDVKS